MKVGSDVNFEDTAGYFPRAQQDLMPGTLWHPGVQTPTTRDGDQTTD